MAVVGCRSLYERLNAAMHATFLHKQLAKEVVCTTRLFCQCFPGPASTAAAKHFVFGSINGCREAPLVAAVDVKQCVRIGLERRREDPHSLQRVQHVLHLVHVKRVVHVDADQVASTTVRIVRPDFRGDAFVSCDYTRQYICVWFARYIETRCRV